MADYKFINIRLCKKGNLISFYLYQTNIKKRKTFAQHSAVTSMHKNRLH